MTNIVRLKKAIIKWSYPYSKDGAFTKDICYEGYGLYCISRVFNENESILYIGKTNCNFYSRLNEHDYNWLNDYRGIKKIRFGTIILPKVHCNDLIHDLEGGIIYDIQPIYNKCRKTNYTFNNCYKIENIGYRGKIPKIVNMKEHCY